MFRLRYLILLVLLLVFSSSPSFCSSASHSNTPSPSVPNDSVSSSPSLSSSLPFDPTDYHPLVLEEEKRQIFGVNKKLSIEDFTLPADFIYKDAIHSSSLPHSLPNEKNKNENPHSLSPPSYRSPSSSSIYSHAIPIQESRLSPLILRISSYLSSLLPISSSTYEIILSVDDSTPYELSQLLSSDREKDKKAEEAALLLFHKYFQQMEIVRITPNDSLEQNKLWDSLVYIYDYVIFSIADKGNDIMAGTVVMMIIVSIFTVGFIFGQRLNHNSLSHSAHFVSWKSFVPVAFVLFLWDFMVFILVHERGLLVKKWNRLVEEGPPANCIRQYQSNNNIQIDNGHSSSSSSFFSYFTSLLPSPLSYISSVFSFSSCPPSSSPSSSNICDEYYNFIDSPFLFPDIFSSFIKWFLRPLAIIGGAFGEFWAAFIDKFPFWLQFIVGIIMIILTVVAVKLLLVECLTGGWMRVRRKNDERNDNDRIANDLQNNNPNNNNHLHPATPIVHLHFSSLHLPSPTSTSTSTSVSTAINSDIQLPLLDGSQCQIISTHQNNHNNNLSRNQGEGEGDRGGDDRKEDQRTIDRINEIQNDEKNENLSRNEMDNANTDDEKHHSFRSRQAVDGNKYGNDNNFVPHSSSPSSSSSPSPPSLSPSSGSSSSSPITNCIDSEKKN